MKGRVKPPLFFLNLDEGNEEYAREVLPVHLSVALSSTEVAVVSASFHTERLRVLFQPKTRSPSGNLPHQFASFCLILDLLWTPIGHQIESLLNHSIQSMEWLKVWLCNEIWRMGWGEQCPQHDEVNHERWLRLYRRFWKLGMDSQLSGLAGFSYEYGSLPLFPDGSHLVEPCLPQKLNLCFYRKGNIDVIGLVWRQLVVFNCLLIFRQKLLFLFLC